MQTLEKNVSQNLIIAKVPTRDLWAVKLHTLKSQKTLSGSSFSPPSHGYNNCGHLVSKPKAACVQVSEGLQKIAMLSMEDHIGDRTDRGHRNRKNSNVGCDGGAQAAVMSSTLSFAVLWHPQASCQARAFETSCISFISLQGWRASSTPQGAFVSCLLWKPLSPPQPFLRPLWPWNYSQWVITSPWLTVRGIGAINQPLWPCCRPFWLDGEGCDYVSVWF